MDRIRPIPRSKSLKEKTYDALRELIITGGLEQAKLHNEMKLAKQLGVSRTPVREALLELCREGMVEFVPRKGIRIREITAKQVKEVFELRQIIEGHIAEVTAGKLTPADRKKLDALIEKQKRMAKQHNDVAFIETDKEFHVFLASKMDNHQLATILQNLRDQMHFMGIYAIKNALRIEQVLIEHINIITALKEGNGEQARIEMSRHLGNTEKVLLDMIKRREAPKRIASSL